jgi:methyltransferase family protein
MYNILKTLDESQTALDLGCGNGSFDYSSCRCKMIGIDIVLNPTELHRDGDRLQYIRSSANQIPLTGGSIDAVICHHSMEHFAGYARTLDEIHRVLKPNGMLWIAVPNGYSFDDALYRFTDAGHSHVNRFRLDRLIREVQTRTDLKLVQSFALFSGFVYLKKPLPGLPSLFGRLMRILPDSWNRAAVIGINASTRLVDKVLGSRTSQYGWALVFSRHEVKLESLPSYFNVCWKCGSGHGAEHLKSSGLVKAVLGIRFFRCPSCQEKSIFFDPPDGLT